MSDTKPDESIGESMSKRQEELFNQIRRIGLRLSDTGCYMQNDIQRLLDGRHATYAEVGQNGKDMDSQLLSIMEEIDSVRNQSRLLYAYFDRQGRQ